MNFEMTILDVSRSATHWCPPRAALLIRAPSMVATEVK